MKLRRNCKSNVSKLRERDGGMSSEELLGNAAWDSAAEKRNAAYAMRWELLAVLRWGYKKLNR